MQTIVIVQGRHLEEVLRSVGVREADWHKVHTLRIDQRGDGVAVKVNSGMWSSTLGRRADQGGY